MPLVALLQSLMAGFAFIMAVLVRTPFCCIAGMALLSGAAITASLPYGRVNPFRERCVAAAWAGALLVLGGAMFARNTVFLDDYYVLIGALTAVTLFMAGGGKQDNPGKKHWKMLGLTWAFCTSAGWLANSHLLDREGEFYGALLANVALLVLYRLEFRPRAIGIQTVNTLILLLIGFPIVDLFLRPHTKADVYSNPQKYYSYERSKKDPFAQGNWTRYFDEQWLAMSRNIMLHAAGENVPFTMRPDSRCVLFQSSVVINHRGFRGPEIPEDKGNAYRIVALGESTTFGVTLMPEDRPWPEILQDMIRDRLKLARPVAVINAGVPGYDLRANLSRMEHEILPLKPDMIISYHGLNGFHLIDGDLPLSYARPPPAYVDRPLKLLGDFEYAVKSARYKKNLVRTKPKRPTATGDPMDSKYAQAYTQLIDIARTNGIRLVLANYSMAVNSHSDPDVISFYRDTRPYIEQEIKANVAHTAIIQQLGKLHPEVTLVDTQPQFDGQHQYFIDVMHFTQAGRQHMAEVFFTAIRNTLEQELGEQNTAVSGQRPEK